MPSMGKGVNQCRCQAPLGALLVSPNSVFTPAVYGGACISQDGLGLAAVIDKLQVTNVKQPRFICLCPCACSSLVPWKLYLFCKVCVLPSGLGQKEQPLMVTNQLLKLPAGSDAHFHLLAKERRMAAPNFSEWGRAW